MEDIPMEGIRAEHVRAVVMASGRAATGPQQNGADPRRDNLLWRRPVSDKINPAVLRQAWLEVITRSERLRTSLVRCGQTLVPRVQDHASGRLALVTFSRDSSGELWELLAHQVWAQPFDLDHPPLARAVLLRVGSRSELLVCGHRRVFDEETGAALIDELLSISTTRPNPHPDSPTSAVDTTWMRSVPPALASARNSVQVVRAAGRPHLHLTHPGGGGTAVYRLLAAALPKDWTVTASDDVGRGDSVEALAATYLRDVLLVAGPPDIVGGWSLGGLVAFQTARLLAASGRQPPPLVLLDAPPPGTAGQMPDEPRTNLEFAGMLWTSLGLSTSTTYPLELDTGQDMSAMRILSSALRWAGEPVEVDILLQQLDVYRRHRRALTTYAPTVPLATETLIVHSAIGDEVRSWRRLLRLEPTVATIPGGHYDLLRPGRVDEVARLIMGLARSSS